MAQVLTVIDTLIDFFIQLSAYPMQIILIKI